LRESRASGQNHAIAMAAKAKRKFTAILEQDNTRLRWVIARIPFDIEKAWPERRGMRVRGMIAGFAFRSSLMPNPLGDGRVLLVNKKMQAAAKAGAGSKVRIELEPDLEERPATVPAELAGALREDKQLRRWFDGLGSALRRDIGKWVAEPKNQESREKRAARAAEWLLLTMEGERETPPVLKVRFQRNPDAQAGWEGMRAARRRSHLLGIFHLQSGEGRERRADAAIEDAIRVAKKLE
jgi:uncharacterized protein YdeI (YjbR/CyaY-like superfamily)